MAGLKRNAARSSAWHALHLSLTFSRLLVHQPGVAHRSPPCRFLGDAICLILRCCGCGVGERSEHAELEAWSGMPHVLRRGGLCTKNKPH
ncbi:MAG: hypothetical protein WA977_00495 [Halobacteriota archaeon]